MTQTRISAECRQLEEMRVEAATRLQHITATLAMDPELGDSWWGTLYDTTAQAIRDIDAAMTSAGCSITSRQGA
jgi:hypothetical protein